MASHGRRAACEIRARPAVADLVAAPPPFGIMILVLADGYLLFGARISRLS